MKKSNRHLLDLMIKPIKRQSDIRLLPMRYTDKGTTSSIQYSCQKKFNLNIIKKKSGKSKARHILGNNWSKLLKYQCHERH